MENKVRLKLNKYIKKYALLRKRWGAKQTFIFS